MSGAERPSFTQRNGLSPLPQQLNLGELSPKFIALVWGAIYADMRRNTEYGYGSESFGERWRSIIFDFNVEFLNNTSINRVGYNVENWEEIFEKALKDSNYGDVFDLLEYLHGNKNIQHDTRVSIREAFKKSHLAYRMLEDGMIIAVGTEEQATAVENALQASSEHSLGASSHLKAAGAALTRNDWALSVRESITAVESAARLLAGDSGTLGDALRVLGKKSTINPLLKSALEKLYAYTNAEGGIRHANVFDDKAKVDEDDALFMLGACASFVTFLLSKKNSD